MAALGMICEWNPFHLGHAWLLRELKRCYSLPVVCIMSGNFVQRPWGVCSRSGGPRNRLGTLRAAGLRCCGGRAL